MGYHFDWVTNEWYKELFKDELAGLSELDREAVIFRKYVENIPIAIEDNDLFAGYYGYDDFGEEKMNKFAHDFLENFRIREEGYAKNPDKNRILGDKFCTGYCGNDRGHMLMDYNKILKCGLIGYEKEIYEELAKPCDELKKNELHAMLHSLESAKIFVARYEALAREKAEKSENMQDKERYLRIAEACKITPYLPATNFFNALQGMYLAWSLICIAEVSWCSMSIGSFTKIMHPYFEKSKQDGMKNDEIIALLVELFKKLDNYGGMDCAFSIGSVDENGNDTTYELDYLVLEAEKKSHLRSPLLSLRVNKNTPEKLLEATICPELFAMGQPTYYSEESCKECVMNRGIKEEEAKKYQISTCMQMEFPGAQVNASWGITLNLNLPLELCLLGGKTIREGFPLELKTIPKTNYKNIDELYEQYSKYLTEIITYLNGENQRDKNEHRETCPFVSMLTDDCIKRGKDRWWGGAKYYDVTMESFAFANAGDGFNAIDELVFKQKKYTLSDFVEAVKSNYVGYEKLRADILAVPKYGQNNQKADECARKIMQMETDIAKTFWKDGYRILPSLHTLDNEVNVGGRCPASFDGRLAWTPVNKNAGPSNIVRSEGPTSVALSACHIDQIKNLSGGQALDIHFAVRSIDNPEKKKKIASFIRTYLSYGGLQLQVNALSAETLQKAYDHPEDYKDLIVRIGGHSRYFNELPNDVKLEFIERIGIEEGCSL